MNIHEYQAKEIFKRYQIPVNEGRVVGSAQEAFQAAKEMAKPGKVFAVKAQVHAGGRGKAGGIKIVKTPQDVRNAATEILAKKKLVNHQTGPEGKPIHKLLIEATSPLETEYYAGIVLDRAAAKPCFIVSKSGGTEIEETAAKDPSKITKEHFSVHDGLDRSAAERLAKTLSSGPERTKFFSDIFQALAELFLDLDASLVEINPLSVTANGEAVAVDAKINFDVNALYRHPDIAAMRDPSQEDPREVEAKKFDLSYVGLSGNIGCIVNGAGLAMATMDIIKYAGGDPANFLDVGGGAGKEKVAAAFKIILKDPSVQAVLVNIFGGIMRCDVVAEGILEAAAEIGVKVPIVVRLEGTNVEEGKAILKKSGLNIIPAATFEEAAEKVVAAV